MKNEALSGANLRKVDREKSLRGHRRTANPIPSREASNWSCWTAEAATPSADGHKEPSEG